MYVSMMCNHVCNHGCNYDERLAEINNNIERGLWNAQKVNLEEMKASLCLGKANQDQLEVKKRH